MSKERMNPNFNLESCLRNKVNEAKRYLEDKHKRQKDGACEESSYAESFIYYFQDVETILDLYNNQKQRIETLQVMGKILNGRCDELKALEEEHRKENGELRKELKQEKEKNKELEEELSKYISGEYFTEKQAKHLEITRKMFWINKDKIRDMKRYREFELQQEYKEFKDDIEWKTYNKILEEE